MNVHPVIIIEEKAGDKHLLLEMLLEMGCKKPLTFTTPTQAFEFFETMETVPLFISSDISMSRTDGIRMRAVLIESCVAIKPVPFYLLTTSMADWEEALALHPDAKQYFINQYTFKSMPETVEKIMAIISAESTLEEIL